MIINFHFITLSFIAFFKIIIIILMIDGIIIQLVIIFKSVILFAYALFMIIKLNR